MVLGTSVSVTNFFNYQMNLKSKEPFPQELHDELQKHNSVRKSAVRNSLFYPKLMSGFLDRGDGSSGEARQESWLDQKERG